MKGELIVKRFLSFITFLILFITFACLISAENLDVSSNATFDQGISNVLINQLSEKDFNDLQNEDLYLKNTPFESVENEPVLKIYTDLFMWHSSKDLNEILSLADQLDYIHYAILNKNIMLTKGIYSDRVYIGTSPISINLNYINDIKKITSDFTILGKKLKILNIYCFDEYSSHFGASVYYVTDNGTYIKHYKTEYSSGVWFEEEEYNKYSTDYYNYISSYEYNHGADGTLVGGGLSFIDYLTTKTDWESSQESTENQGDSTNSENKQENPSNNAQNETPIEQNNGAKKHEINGKIIACAVICITFACVAVASAGAVTAILLVKKRKR